MTSIHLGTANDTGAAIELTEEDLRTHVHGIGKSRTGKSKLIESIARDLILDRQGFCLIDPHGSVYEPLVEWLAYISVAYRTPREDIILFDPSSRSRVVGFNPFKRYQGDPAVQAKNLVSATTRVWGSLTAIDTPRLSRWLRNLFRLLLELDLPIDVARYLLVFDDADEAVRHHLVGRLPDGLTKQQWTRLLKRKPDDFDNLTESSLNRIFEYLDGEQVRRILNAAQTINVEDIIESGKVLLVNLQPARGLFAEEDARLIGTLLLNEIWDVAIGRKTNIEKPEPWFVFIDEFQKFLTPTMHGMLDEVAKRGIHLFMFHHNLKQVGGPDDGLGTSVMQQADARLVFGGLTRDDALTMVGELFTGQIDRTEVKDIIEETYAWPVVERDENVTISQARRPNPVEGEDDIVTETEARSDIRATGYEERTRDRLVYKDHGEILWDLADRLKLQYQRHFFVQRPGKPTIAAITPFVESFSVSPKRREAFIETLLAGFPTPAEVDAHLEELHARLRGAAASPSVSTPARSGKPARRKPPRDPDEPWEEPPPVV